MRDRNYDKGDKGIGGKDGKRINRGREIKYKAQVKPVHPWLPCK